MRIRTGNIQLGDDRPFEDLFSEPRFNSWAVGEVHTLDSRLIPNGRRDQYEQNVHCHNLVNHLVPLARDVSRRYRTSSLRRTWLREFEIHEAGATEKANLIAPGALSRTVRTRLLREMKKSVFAMEKLATPEQLKPEAERLRACVKRLRKSVESAIPLSPITDPLAHFKPFQRPVYRQIIDLIF